MDKTPSRQNSNHSGGPSGGGGFSSPRRRTWSPQGVPGAGGPRGRGRRRGGRPGGFGGAPRPPQAQTAAAAQPAAPRAPGEGRPGGAGRGRRGKFGGRGKGHFNKQNRPPRRPRQGEHETKTLTSEPILVPPLGAGNVRIIPLGGVEEIGRNMTAIEYGDDIIVVDCGFQFKLAETPGVDYILPNTQYLEENKEKIRGMIITHAHLDHIGGIPYITDRLGYPTIYSRKLTTLMIKKRQDEFPHLKNQEYYEVEKSSVVTLGKVKVRFFSVTHTIPDSMGVIIETPYGDVVITGDIKLDHENGEPTDAEKDEFKQFAKRNVLFLCADSTNVEKPGFSIPESTVFKTFEKIIREVQGRMIIGVFASQLERIMKIIDIAEKNGKHIVVEGRSMRNNVDIIKEMKLLKPKKETFITADEMDDFPPDKIVILATGAQGDEFAALMRIGNKTHKQVKLTPRDTIVLSASVIPGNEVSVQKLKDNLARQGVKIITYQTSDVHASGHGNREELTWIHKQIKPKFFMPMHGNHYMLRLHAELAENLGMPKQNIVIPDNGSVIDITNEGTHVSILKEKAPSNYRLVDGFNIGNRQEVVLRDRQSLAEDGMFVIIATVNLRTGKLKKSPDIISRGFVYLRESQEMLQEARLLIKKNVERDSSAMNPINLDYVKDRLTDIISAYLLQKTGKRPMVIPVLIGI